MRGSSATASLLGLQQDAFSFVTGLQQLLREAAPQEVHGIAQLVLEPLEEQVGAGLGLLGWAGRLAGKWGWGCCCRRWQIILCLCIMRCC
jgi:hypothetical protein